MATKKQRLPRLTDEQKQKIRGLKAHHIDYGTIASLSGVAISQAVYVCKPSIAEMKAVKARAKGLCEKCGKTPPRPGHVHHRLDVLPAPGTLNAPEHLEFLCGSCHRKQHARPETKEAMHFRKCGSYSRWALYNIAKGNAEAAGDDARLAIHNANLYRSGARPCDCVMCPTCGETVMTKCGECKESEAEYRAKYPLWANYDFDRREFPA